VVDTDVTPRGQAPALTNVRAVARCVSVCRARQSIMPRSRPAFTLIELIVVIVVLGLLAGLVAPQIFGRVAEAKAVSARTQLQLLAAALDGYRLDNGSYPTTAQGLGALIAERDSPRPLGPRVPLRRARHPEPHGLRPLHPRPRRQARRRGRGRRHHRAVANTP
jgi:general secretion pathway protein G